MSNWLKRLFGGGSESSSTEATEPVTAPEPPSMPAEPVVESASEPEASGAGGSDAGDEPA